MKKQLDYKLIGINILLTLGFVGAGYGIGLTFPYITDSNYHCDSLTDNDWQNSPYHNQFKSFDEFKNTCMKWQHATDENLKIAPIVLASLLAIFSIPCVYIIGIYKEEIK